MLKLILNSINSLEVSKTSNLLEILKNSNLLTSNSKNIISILISKESSSKARENKILTKLDIEALKILNKITLKDIFLRSSKDLRSKNLAIFFKLEANFKNREKYKIKYKSFEEYE